MENRVYYLTQERHFDCIIHELPQIPEPEFVRVKYLYCSICGGDYSRFIGRRPEYPMSLGHEFIAEIVCLGAEISTELHVGEFVISDFNYRCGKCLACRKNMSHFCEKLDSQKFSNRAFADYADIHYSYLYPVHFNADKAYLGTLIEPLSCVIHAFDKYNLKDIENSVLVFGVGGIGMLTAFYLQIVCKIKTDVYDIIPQKMFNIQAAFGCGHVTERPYNLIVECTNSLSGLVSCIKHQLRPEICSFSHLYGENTNTVYDTLAKQEATIYFPLRNGDCKNLIRSYEAISTFWQSSFDKALTFYDKSIISKAFVEKETIFSSKQIICLEDISNKNPLH